MPTPTSTRWVDTLVQRVDRIRRARNLCELQRTTYMVFAAVVAGTTTLLVTALFGSARLFAVVAWSTLAGLVVTAALLVREAIVRWLSRERAVAWIEAGAALHGRLRSIIELDARGEQAGTRFLLPLLAAENERVLPSWEPRRMVPRRVPRVALGIALASTFALMATLTLTPVLYPRVPVLAGTDVAATSARANALRELADRSDTDDDTSPLARIPADLQERIRHTVWGDAWNRVREAMTKAQRDGTRTARGGPSGEPRARAGTEGPWQLAGRARPNARPPSDGLGGRSGSADDASAAAPAPRRALEDAERETPREGAAGAGAGAGTSTDPDLYGAAAPPDLASRPHFALGLVTRMRLSHRQGGPGDVAPPRARDRLPLLAGNDRHEELAHEMAVPRAYEPIVRQVFAHRDGEGIE